MKTRHITNIKHRGYYFQVTQKLNVLFDSEAVMDMMIDKGFEYYICKERTFYMTKVRPEFWYGAKTYDIR